MLECPHCHDCHDIPTWNKEVQNSVIMNRATELIPEDLEDWDTYANKESGLVDCPSCESVCNYEDINSV